MESNLTADNIYCIFQTLKKDGRSDAEIKKTLVQIFMNEKNAFKDFCIESVMTPQKRQSFFSQKNILYSIGLIASSYLLYLFLQAENIL